MSLYVEYEGPVDGLPAEFREARKNGRRIVIDEENRPRATFRDSHGHREYVGQAPLKVLYHDNERLARFAGREE